MSKRGKILVGMALGAVWSVVLIWIGSTQGQIPVFSRVLIEPFYFLAPGIIVLLMIARLAQRRFFDDQIIDGQLPAQGSGADIDQKVLRNTIEQLILAICIWMPVSYLLPSTGLGVVMCLSINFAVARIAFWIGYHVSPPLRAFGFAATFYPTIAALLWAGIWWLTL